MKYVGIQTQQARNNIKSTILLISFPILVLGLLYIGCFALHYFSETPGYAKSIDTVNMMFFSAMPLVVIGVLIWFLIAFYSNVKIIDYATGATSLSRMEDMRIYNLVENLCISVGMQMPKIHVIEDSAMNAYASGVSKSSYTVTLTRGLINRLNDEELEGVIAHELMHIRNNDVRVLIISIVFVGIFSLISQIAFRTFLYSGGRTSNRGGNKKGGGTGLIMLLILILSAVGYFISIILRFTISRKREYMADAGAAYMTKNPKALANALRKISGRSCLTKQHDEAVAQLFIEHDPEKKSFIGSIFATHPPIDKRIAILEQF